MNGILEFFYVLAYLVSPADLPQPPESRVGWATMKAFADRADLARPYHFSTSWQCEIRWTRREWRECLGAPPLADLSRLPPRAVMDSEYTFAYKYRQTLEAEADVCPWHRDACCEVLDELAELTKLRGLMSNCLNSVYPGDQRAALKKLRDKIGGAAYYAGEWPPAVPYWRFTRRD